MDFEKQSAIDLATSCLKGDNTVIKKAIKFLQSKGIQVPVNN